MKGLGEFFLVNLRRVYIRKNVYIYNSESISRYNSKDENKEEDFAFDNRILKLRPAKMYVWIIRQTSKCL
jgi:hypothetical protein